MESQFLVEPEYVTVHRAVELGQLPESRAEVGIFVSGCQKAG